VILISIRLLTSAATRLRNIEARIMPPRAKKSKPTAASDNAQSQKTRLWLMYPPTNVRQASVTDEIGVGCLELEGQRSEIKAAIQWLEKLGISVEPVEINVIES